MTDNVKRTTRSLEHRLSDEELLVRSREVARTVAELGQVQEEAKIVAADFKGRIKRLTLHISSESVTVARGFEYRPVECVEQMNEPTLHLKTIMRTDTGERVGIENMTAEDEQPSLFED